MSDLVNDLSLFTHAPAGIILSGLLLAWLVVCMVCDLRTRQVPAVLTLLPLGAAALMRLSLGGWPVVLQVAVLVLISDFPQPKWRIPLAGGVCLLGLFFASSRADFCRAGDFLRVGDVGVGSHRRGGRQDHPRPGFALWRWVDLCADCIGRWFPGTGRPDRSPQGNSLYGGDHGGTALWLGLKVGWIQI